MPAIRRTLVNAGGKRIVLGAWGTALRAEFGARGKGAAALRAKSPADLLAAVQAEFRPGRNGGSAMGAVRLGSLGGRGRRLRGGIGLRIARVVSESTMGASRAAEQPAEKASLLIVAAAMMAAALAPTAEREETHGLYRLSRSLTNGGKIADHCKE